MTRDRWRDIDDGGHKFRELDIRWVVWREGDRVVIQETGGKHIVAKRGLDLTGKGVPDRVYRAALDFLVDIAVEEDTRR